MFDPSRAIVDRLRAGLYLRRVEAKRTSKKAFWDALDQRIERVDPADRGADPARRLIALLESAGGAATIFELAARLGESEHGVLEIAGSLAHRDLVRLEHVGDAPGPETVVLKIR